MDPFASCLPNSGPSNPYRDDPRGSSSFQNLRASHPLFSSTEYGSFVRKVVLLLICGVFFVLLSSPTSEQSPTASKQLQRRTFLKGAADRDTIEEKTYRTMKVMTFNLRFASASDGRNSWRFRKDHLMDIINRYHPVVMGTQEGLKDQLAEIQEGLTHPYERFGVEREENGEFEQIFYDSNELERLDGGNFWLSDHPDIPGQTAWGAPCVRMTTWCKFRYKVSGEVFYFFNTQFDHMSEQSRDKSGALMKDMMEKISNNYEHPVFVVGDFNTYRYTPTYHYLVSEEGAGLHEAWPEAEEKIGNVSYTYHAWAGLKNDGEKTGKRAENHIDWIFFRPQMRVLKAEVITETREDGRYPSDHYPIQADILLPSQSSN